MLPLDEIPAPGFRLVSGKHRPLNQGQKYQVQFANGYVDRKHEYTASQLKWIHAGHLWDVIAVKPV
jgi:hypothetical protein